MKPLVLLLAILLAVKTIVAATAAPTDLQRTLDDLQKAVAKAASKMQQPDKNAFINADQYFAALRAAIDRGEYSEAERMLASLRAGLQSGPKNIGLLIEEAIARIHSQIVAKESAIDQAVEAISAEVRAKIASHATVRDFDAAFEKLSGLSVPRASYGYNDNSLGARVEALRTFVSRWQDYLTQMNQGNAESAANALTELVNLSARIPVVPRSELLALQGDVAKLRETQ